MRHAYRSLAIGFAVRLAIFALCALGLLFLAQCAGWAVEQIHTNPPPLECVALDTCEEME